MDSLKNISQRIINAEKEHSFSVIQELFDFFNQFSLLVNTSFDTQLMHGLALSEKHAAECILDYKRTCSFIKGVYNAIQKSIHLSKGNKVHILYAGCGPYAALLIPVLSIIKREQLVVTLIDVNPHSIQVVEKIVKHLGINKSIETIKVADAIVYKHQQKLDIIITETMFRALTREPQVAISENLIPQLKSNGVIIPEEIKIGFNYTSFSKEPILDCGFGKYRISQEFELNRQGYIKELFSINKDTVFSKVRGSFFFESDWIEVDEIIEQQLDICIYTELKIFGQETLLKAESLITNPYCVGSVLNIRNKKSFKLKYKTEKLPQWEVMYT